MVKKQQTLLFISKLLSNLSCLVSDRSSVMKKKSNTLFNERRENLFKENITAFSVQGKSRTVSVLQKNRDNHPKHFRTLIMVLTNIMKIHIWSHLYLKMLQLQRKILFYRSFKKNENKYCI